MDPITLAALIVAGACGFKRLVENTEEQEEEQRKRAGGYNPPRNYSDRSDE